MKTFGKRGWEVVLLGLLVFMLVLTLPAWARGSAQTGPSDSPGYSGSPGNSPPHPGDLHDDAGDSNDDADSDGGSHTGGTDDDDDYVGGDSGPGGGDNDDPDEFVDDDNGDDDAGSSHDDGQSYQDDDDNGDESEDEDDKTEDEDAGNGGQGQDQNGDQDRERDRDREHERDRESLEDGDDSEGARYARSLGLCEEFAASMVLLARRAGVDEGSLQAALDIMAQLMQQGYFPDIAARSDDLHGGSTGGASFAELDDDVQSAVISALVELMRTRDRERLREELEECAKVGMTVRQAVESLIQQ